MLQYLGFDYNFVLYGCFGAVSLVVTSLAIPAKSKIEAAMAHQPLRLSRLSVLCKPNVIFFLFEVLLFGAALGVVERLLFVYLQNELQGSTVLCGVVVAVTVLLELVCRRCLLLQCCVPPPPSQHLPPVLGGCPALVLLQRQNPQEHWSRRHVADCHGCMCVLDKRHTHARAYPFLTFAPDGSAPQTASGCTGTRC